VTSMLRPGLSATVRMRGEDDPVQATTPELSLRSDGQPWRVWHRWVAYTMAGYLVSGVVITAVPRRIPGGFASAFIAGLVGLAIVGLLQWLILRHWAHGLRWWSWVLATVLGQLAGTSLVTIAVVGSLVTGALGGIGAQLGGHAIQLATKLMTGALLGGVEGFAQWLVLRRYLRAASWWIMAVMLAEAVAAASSLLIGRGAALGGLVALAITRLTSGLIVGAITGAVLVRLLRERREIPTGR
jgi:hypothetical protein